MAYRSYLVKDNFGDDIPDGTKEHWDDAAYDDYDYDDDCNKDNNKVPQTSPKTLKPCPFCGSHTLYIVKLKLDYEYPYCDSEDSTIAIFCNTCKTIVHHEYNEIEGDNNTTRAQAIEAWNKRECRPCYATEHTHETCKYSINRGWTENITINELKIENDKLHEEINKLHEELNKLNEAFQYQIKCNQTLHDTLFQGKEK